MLTLIQFSTTKQVSYGTSVGTFIIYDYFNALILICFEHSQLTNIVWDYKLILKILIGTSIVDCSVNVLDILIQPFLT